MEELGKTTGYLPIWDRPWVGCGRRKLRIIDGRDRAWLPGWSICSNTQYQNRDRRKIFLSKEKERVTNLNLAWKYGTCQLRAQALNIASNKAFAQVLCGFEPTFIGSTKFTDLQDSSQLDFSKEWQAGAPAFYRYDFQLTTPWHFILDMTGWVVFVNGHNLAASRSDRTTSLYVPLRFQRSGFNSLIVFGDSRALPRDNFSTCSTTYTKK